MLILKGATIATLRRFNEIKVIELIFASLNDNVILSKYKKFMVKCRELYAWYKCTSKLRKTLEIIL